MSVRVPFAPKRHRIIYDIRFLFFKFTTISKVGQLGRRVLYPYLNGKNVLMISLGLLYPSKSMEKKTMDISENQKESSIYTEPYNT